MTIDRSYTHGAPPVPFTIADHPRTAESLKKGVREVAAKIWRDRNDDRVITWARNIVENTPGALEPRGHPDPHRMVQALFTAWKKKVGWVEDPSDTELLIGTVQLLCLDPNGYCVPAGDCDDQLIGFGACVATLGIPVALSVRVYVGMPQAHIVMKYDGAQSRTETEWFCLDPSVESGECSTRPYREALMMIVGEGSERGPGALVMMGAPPSTMGDEAASQLSPGEVQGWLDQLAAARASLASNSARLRAMTAALAQVRADLGLPKNDPTPVEGGATSGLPLYAYTQSNQWTAEAQAAQAKVLATSDFAVQAIGQAIAGQRGLTWSIGDQDLYIASLPGDAFRVVMYPNANDVKVPTWFDPTTNAEVSQMGIIQIPVVGIIVIAGAIATIALSIAVAWNMDKIMVSLVQTHHDTMLQEIAKAQTDCIASGKCTPEQIVAMQKAQTDFANVTKPDLPSSGISMGWVIVATVLGVVAGVAGAYYASTRYDLKMPMRRAAPEAAGAFLEMLEPRRPTRRRRRRARREAFAYAA